MNPSIPRQGRDMYAMAQRKHKEAVSIRDGFEEYDDDDTLESRRISPGPGQYATHDSSFMKQSSRWDLLPGNGQDRFGSRVSRFNEKHKGTALGPG